MIPTFYMTLVIDTIDCKQRGILVEDSTSGKYQSRNYGVLERYVFFLGTSTHRLADSRDSVFVRRYACLRSYSIPHQGHITLDIRSTLLSLQKDCHLHLWLHRSYARMYVYTRKLVSLTRTVLRAPWLLCVYKQTFREMAG